MKLSAAMRPGNTAVAKTQTGLSSTFKVSVSAITAAVLDEQTALNGYPLSAEIDSILMMPPLADFRCGNAARMTAINPKTLRRPTRARSERTEQDPASRAA
ncbi:MAG: hypothetical protein WA418_13335 [Bradyrhizobium sp.]